jgi:hypothetical protein
MQSTDRNYLRLQLQPTAELVDVTIEGHLFEGLMAEATRYDYLSTCTLWYDNLELEPAYDAEFVRWSITPFDARFQSSHPILSACRPILTYINQLGLFPNAVITVRKAPDIDIHVTWDDPRVFPVSFRGYSTDTMAEILTQCHRRAQVDCKPGFKQSNILGFVHNGQILPNSKTPQDVSTQNDDACSYDTAISSLHR